MIRSLCEQDYPEYANIGLLLKEKSAQLVRNWMADPIDGCILRKEWVVGSFFQDDVVSTPVGAGYIRMYRPEDRICVVVYPWGNGWIHVDNIKSMFDALKDEEKMKSHGFFPPLEHQHLYENVVERPYSNTHKYVADEWNDTTAAFLKESSQLSMQTTRTETKPFPLYEKTSGLHSHADLINVLQAELESSSHNCAISLRLSRVRGRKNQSMYPELPRCR
uniref:Uncharacterized protein AlNc14C9G1146 n=1 Tax=Albugo laibachii Nc14 TaxID=890382 RepID=F0W287_9STRA|nr:conserved hypothetical protein [Albugo laibachii Nc14]|eukprot:CCA15172.1 conserved hypothetical protein [Albugo laibachii Nc14]